MSYTASCLRCNELLQSVSQLPQRLRPKLRIDLRSLRAHLRSARQIRMSRSVPRHLNRLQSSSPRPVSQNPTYPSQPPSPMLQCPFAIDRDARPRCEITAPAASSPSNRYRASRSHCLASGRAQVASGRITPGILRGRVTYNQE